MKNTNQEEAVKIFERLRSAVENNVAYFDNQELNYTVSIGVCTTKEYTLADTINQADMMLYNAKQNGKNQVIFS